MAFRPLKKEEFVQPDVERILAGEQPLGFQPLPIEGTGGIGTELPRDVAAAISRQRMISKETPTMGSVPQESQPIAAISRGLLGGSTGELGEAALESAIQKDTFDPGSPQFTNPDLYMASELVGGFLPIGKILAAPGKVKQLFSGGKEVIKAAPSLMKTGGLYGLGYGAAGGEAEALRQDLGFEESIEEIVKGGGKGLAIGGFTGGLLGKAQSLRMNPSETFLALTKPRPGSKAENRAFDFIEGGGLDQAVGSVKNFYKLPKNLTTGKAKDITYATADKLVDKVDEIADRFSDHKLLGSPLRDGLQKEVLDNPLLEALNPSIKKELTDMVDKISSDRGLKEGISLQKHINSRLKGNIEAVKSGGDPKLNDEIRFLDTLRRYNSKLIDDAVTGLTGTSENPYRAWGSVHELANILHSRHKNLVNLRAQEKNAGFLGSISRGKGLSSIVTGPYRFLSGGEMKNADTLVSSLFNKIPEYQATSLLPKDVSQRLGRSVFTPEQQDEALRGEIERLVKQSTERLP